MPNNTEIVTFPATIKIPKHYYEFIQAHKELFGDLDTVLSKDLIVDVNMVQEQLSGMALSNLDVDILPDLKKRS